MREGFRVEIPNRVRKEIRDLPDKAFLAVQSELEKDLILYGSR
jgi:hypothetical protein